MKLAIVGCGLMGGALAALASPQAELLAIDRDAEKARALAEARGGGWACGAEAAKDADVIAVVVPAAAVDGAFRGLAGIAKSGALVLDMATKGTIPREAREARPDVRFLEAKIVGSAVGVLQGLPALLAADTQDASVLEELRRCFPGFEAVLSGDPKLAREVNEKGTYNGIRAAAETEAALRALGLPEEWIRCACGCLVPGIAIGYSRGQMGKFGREIADRILSEMRDGSKT